MKIIEFIKKDVGFFKNAAKTEIRFHEAVYNMFRMKRQKERVIKIATLNKNELQELLVQERKVLASMALLLLFLTGYLLWAEDWAGFALWLLFVALNVRSIVLIKKLKEQIRKE